MKKYEDRFHFNAVLEPHHALLLYNTSDPLFADPRVRMALTYAVDKEHIVKNILGQQGVAAVGAIGYHSPFRNPDLQPIPYSPAKSLKLLKEAGWSFDRDGSYLQKWGQPFEFTILFFEEIPLHEKVAQYLRLCLNDLGIKTHLLPVQHDELLQRYLGHDEFQAVITEFMDALVDPNLLRRRWCPRDVEKSDAGSFENPDVSRLMDRALQESDPSVRQKLFHELDSLLTSLQPATFLYQRTSLNVLSKRFRLAYPFSSSTFVRFHLWNLSLANK
jgi:ABC-type transport system substrate-binding protein